MGCCGNACFAPGSKCCSSPLKPKSQWYPASLATKCAFDGEETSQLALRGEAKRTEEDLMEESHSPPVTCWNRNLTAFQCAGGDRCCGDVCVGHGDSCCINVNGNTFPCGGRGGGCCGNACFAPGSKCCRSPFKPKSQWYPASLATKCAFDGEETSLLALRGEAKRTEEDLMEESHSRRRLPP